MLVIFLILLPNVLADSDINKYIDLLPDSEKREFIEKVARRIIKDFDSNDTGAVPSKEELFLSEDQLKDNNAYIEDILKQEKENIRRSKGILSKDKDQNESVSEDQLDVKPLKTEKNADNQDIDDTDFTFRFEKGKDYTNVEIDRVIKRSAENITDSEDYESEESGSETESKKIESKTETLGNIESAKEASLNEETEMEITERTESKNESLENVISTTEEIKHWESTTNESKLENIETSTDYLAKNTINNGTILKTSKNYESSETDGENVQINGDDNSKARKSNYEGNETEQNTKNEHDVEYFGVKSSESKSDEYNSVTSTDIGELTTITTGLPDTTSESVAVTENIDESLLGQFTEKVDNGSTKLYTTSNLPSTLTDEGTTKLVVDTTTYKSANAFATTHITQFRSTEHATESTLKPVITMEEMGIIIEDFTSSPPNTTRDDSVTTTGSIKTRKDRNEFKQRAQESEEKEPKEIIDKSIESKDKTSNAHRPKASKKKVEKTTESTNNRQKEATKPAPLKVLNYELVTETVDNHFIELQKVYYNNNNKNKGGKEYQVYEIPANVSPFIQHPEVITQQPYYVPIYNYSPNNAYYDPRNHLDPNADYDNVREQIPGPFSVAENANQINAEDNLDPQELDIQYSETAFENQRKKFGNTPKEHSIHKIPQHDYASSSYSGKKNGKVNPEDYPDSDYYFGRLRKDLERRVYSSNGNFVPNSDEYQHPVHSIQEMNLKDHVRAVRNILFQQKFFGHIPARKDSKEELESKKSVNEANKKGLIRSADDKDISNIAMDYYFGKMKSETGTNTTEGQGNEYIKKVGYFKSKDNHTKSVYVMDESFKENVMKYIAGLSSTNTTNVNPDFDTAIPHTRSQSEKKRKLNDSGFNKKLRNIAMLRNDNMPVKRTKVAEEDDNDAHSRGIFLDLPNMQELNLKLQRRNDEVKVGVYLEILYDMISTDSKALQQYDWLGTTVDIQSSQQKLFELIALVRDQENIHPADIEILRYILFLHKLALQIVEANDFGAQLRKKLALPRNMKKKDKHQMLKEKGLINRVWLYLRTKDRDINVNGDLKKFNNFLMDVEDGLFDLHDAIKSIAKVTKYKNQHWYQNLKDLYLKLDDKHILELLLHMSVSNLYGLIEESAKNGLEDDYVQYMKTNRKETKRTLEELLFVMQIIDEINKNVID